MATPFGLEYSNLTVGKFELDIAQTFNDPLLEFYNRYIVDVVGATSMLRLQLDQLIDYVCNYHPAPQFTFDVFEKQVG